MKEITRKKVVLVVGIVFVIMLVAGCEEQNISNTKSNTKKSRLVAAENGQLKKQLEQRDREIEKQKGLLNKCLKEKKVLEEQSQQNAQVLVDELFKSFGEENTKLRKENEKLKARVQQLEKEIEELKVPAVSKPH